jgi:hypothetical protein
MRRSWHLTDASTPRRLALIAFLTLAAWLTLGDQLVHRVLVLAVSVNAPAHLLIDDVRAAATGTGAAPNEYQTPLPTHGGDTLVLQCEQGTGQTLEITRPRVVVQVLGRQVRERPLRPTADSGLQLTEQTSDVARFQITAPQARVRLTGPTHAGTTASGATFLLLLLAVTALVAGPATAEWTIAQARRHGLARLGTPFALLIALYTLLHTLRKSPADFEIAWPTQLAITLMFAVATSYIFTPAARLDRALQPAGRWLVAHSALAVLILAAAVYASAWLTTPRILFGLGAQGPGYGHDGLRYGWMTDHFAWFQHPVEAPFCYRWLAPWLVHLSGLNIFTGYNLLNALSFFVSCALVYRLARHYDASPAAALIAVFAFASLKFVLKLWLSYPILTDGLGTALMFGILYAVVTNRHALYVVLLTVAIFDRENLLVLIPFHLLHHWPRELARGRVVRLLALQVLPLAAFAWSRLQPVFPPTAPFDAIGLLVAWQNMFLSEANRQGRVILGYVNSLGLIVLAAALGARTLWRFLVAQPAWSYYLAITVLLSVLGGGDVDRFATWLVPLGVCVFAQAGKTDSPRGGHFWLHWLALHAVSMQLFIPWTTSEPFFVSRWAAHAPLEHYRWVTWSALALAAAAGLMLARRPDQPTSSAAAPTAQTAAACSTTR